MKPYYQLLQIIAYLLLLFLLNLPSQFTMENIKIPLTVYLSLLEVYLSYLINIQQVYLRPVKAYWLQPTT